MQYISRAMKRVGYATAGLALLAAACVGGVGGSQNVEDPIPQPTASSPTATPSPTPGQLDIYRTALDPSVAASMDTVYAADGYSDSEMRMAELLYKLTISEKYNRYRRPGAEEQAWLTGKYPDGIDESQDAMLTVLYDLDYGNPKLYASERMKFLEGPLPSCITPDAYGTINQYSRGILDFYTQCDNAQGIVITASASVDPAAFQAAKDTLNTVLNCMRPDVKERLVKAGARVPIIGANEKLTDLPEFKKYKGKLTDDNRQYDILRGLQSNRTFAIGEEAVLNLPNNQYPTGYNLIAHEFGGHATDQIGIGHYGRDANSIDDLYHNTKSSGLWTGTFAITERNEYFAEMVTILFGYHTDEIIPGFSNGINGAEELKAYDPEAYKFMRTVFPCFPE